MSNEYILQLSRRQFRPSAGGCEIERIYVADKTE